MVASPIALPPPKPGSPCPCGSGKLFDDCCAPLLAGARLPATAEELMRSRFTAHVALDDRYLHRTHQPTAHLPFADDRGDEPPLPWTRLVIHAHVPGTNPDTAVVEFSAFFADGEREQALQERSEFHCVDGQWLYTRALRSGPAPLTSAPKAGRNDPCPCGSRKKYKHCCLAKA